MDHKLEFPTYEEMHEKAVKLAHLIKEKNIKLFVLRNFKKETSNKKLLKFLAVKYFCNSRLKAINTDKIIDN